MAVALVTAVPMAAEASAGAVDRSSGLYVVPYKPGTRVEVRWDHTNHEPKNRIDLRGRGGTRYDIVAAAAGTIRYLVDSFSENRPKGNPCNNNYVWIEHPNGELTKYSHMTKGSTTGAAGLEVGDHVETGQFLGYEDDVGCAGRNHLHFEVGVPANPADPINEGGFLYGGEEENRIPRICGIPGQQFVKGKIFVVGDIKPGAREYALHGVPESRYLKLWRQAADCGYRLVWLDGYTDDGVPEFNLVFHNNNPKLSWRSHRRMTSAEYQQRFDKYRDAGYRLSHLDSYAVGNTIRYAAIWTKASGPRYAAYHGLTAAEHQKRLDDLVARGYRPRIISAATVGGVRRVSALFFKIAVGSFEARSLLTPAEYQAKFDSNSAAGRRLVYLNAYSHSGSPRFTAIWWAVPAASIIARHGLSAGGYKAAYDQNTAQGYFTGAVTGYEQAGSVRYAAFWAK